MPKVYHLPHSRCILFLAAEQEKRGSLGVFLEGDNSYRVELQHLGKNTDVYSAPYLEQGVAGMKEEGEVESDPLSIAPHITEVLTVTGQLRGQ